MDAPVLYVIAGPNGIGKTTSIFDLVPSGIPIVNSDEIAREIGHNAPPEINMQEYSNGEALRLMNEYIQNRRSLAIETNLSDIDTWKFQVGVQENGYFLDVLYLSTDDLDVLNARVKERFLRGEHYIRPDVVKERYETSLQLLNHYFNIPDHLQLFDNSTSMRRQVEIKHGKILQKVPNLPGWIIKYLGEHFDQKIKQDNDILSLKSREDVRKAYEEYKQTQSLRKSQ